MLEIEMKFPVVDWAGLHAQLVADQATLDEPRDDVDRYFGAPDRDFAASDEALRIRQIGSSNFVTYKGPKTDPQTKTRTEIEVPLAPGEHVAEEFAALLIHLRYRPVGVVRKRRHVAHLHKGGFQIEVCMDDVDKVGKFVELEIMAEPEALDRARAELTLLAGKLGLGGQERRSYLELFLNARA
jgi:adenylate cyclase, class 2